MHKDFITAAAFQLRSFQPIRSVYGIRLNLEDQRVHRMEAMPPPVTLLSAKAMKNVSKGLHEGSLKAHAYS